MYKKKSSLHAKKTHNMGVKKCRVLFLLNLIVIIGVTSVKAQLNPYRNPSGPTYNNPVYSNQAYSNPTFNNEPSLNYQNGKKKNVTL